MNIPYVRYDKYSAEQGAVIPTRQDFDNALEGVNGVDKDKRDKAASEAAGIAFAICGRQLYRFHLRYCRSHDDALDIIQSTFRKFKDVLEAGQPVRSEGEVGLCNFLTEFSKMAAAEHWAKMRKQKGQSPKKAPDDAPDKFRGVNEIAMDNEQAEVVKYAIELVRGRSEYEQSLIVDSLRGVTNEQLAQRWGKKADHIANARTRLRYELTVSSLEDLFPHSLSRLKHLPAKYLCRAIRRFSQCTPPNTTIVEQASRELITKCRADVERSLRERRPGLRPPQLSSLAEAVLKKLVIYAKNHRVGKDRLSIIIEEVLAQEATQARTR